VSEFFNLTQISSMIVLEEVLDAGVAIAPFETMPPDDLARANRYWERREGMQAQIPSGSVVTGRRDVFASTADGEVWVIRGDHPVALRKSPFLRRVFRDPHPFDDVLNQLFDNGNGYRIILGSHGLKAAPASVETLIAPARTFDTMTNSPAGAVYFSFVKYQIMVTQQPVLVPGIDPSRNAPPRRFDREEEWTPATFNVENLYDFHNDPFDGCDFASDPGCPGVNPPFDFVPGSNAEYQARLGELAHQIQDDLRSPDVILIQEAEDQDVCTVVAGTLACGATNNADGKPETARTTGASCRPSSTAPTVSSCCRRRPTTPSSARRRPSSTTERPRRTTPTSRIPRCSMPTCRTEST
jgi:hypothetical protein